MSCVRVQGIGYSCNSTNKHAFAGQVNSFTHMRSLLVRPRAWHFRGKGLSVAGHKGWPTCCAASAAHKYEEGVRRSHVPITLWLYLTLRLFTLFMLS